MNEPKPFASLSSGLLARKGAARPAMRPQSFRFANEGNGLAMASPSLDDLGWNDMGDDAGHEAATAPVSLPNAPVARLVVPPRVVMQQEELAKRLDFQSDDGNAPAGPAPSITTEDGRATSGLPSFATPASDELSARRAAAGSKPKAAFTLRLDPDRHLRLRLICAVKHKSAQQIVTQALDEFLARQPDNSRLATHG